MVRLLAFLCAIFFGTSAALNLSNQFNFEPATQFPFLASGKGIQGFNLIKEAFVEGEQVFLTKSRFGGSGCLVSPVANTLPEWSVEFSFAPIDASSPSIGFAFWVTRTPLQSYVDTSVFGSKNKWSGLGVFFEASRIATGSYQAVVKGVWNNENVVYRTRASQSTQAFSEAACNLGLKTFVRISLIKATLHVEVRNDDLPMSSWQPLFSYPNIVFPKESFFGFSGSVGFDQPVASTVKISHFQVSTVSSKASESIAPATPGKNINLSEQIPNALTIQSFDSDALLKALSAKFLDLESKVGNLSSKLDQMNQAIGSLSSSTVKQQSVENIANSSKTLGDTLLNQVSKLSETFAAQLEALSQKAAVFENESKTLHNFLCAKQNNRPSSYQIYAVFAIVQAIVIACVYFYLKRQKYEPIKKLI